MHLCVPTMLVHSVVLMVKRKGTFQSMATVSLHRLCDSKQMYCCLSMQAKVPFLAGLDK
jgi:hypothetical protein